MKIAFALALLLGGCLLPQAHIDKRTRGELHDLANGSFPIEPMAILDANGNVEIELDATGAITIKKEAEGKLEGGFYSVPNGGPEYGITREGDFWYANATEAIKIGTVSGNHLDQIAGTRLIVNADGTIVKEDGAQRRSSNRHFRSPPTNPSTALLLAFIVSA